MRMELHCMYVEEEGGDMREERTDIGQEEEKQTICRGARLQN